MLGILILRLSTQVYQVVRKLVDEQHLEGGNLRLTVRSVYGQIKRSNSGLNRRSKKLLEDSIERVLEVVKGDALGDHESDSIDEDFEGLEDGAIIPVGSSYQGYSLAVLAGSAFAGLLT